MWLFGKSDTTKRAYRSDIERFQSFNGNKAIRNVTVADIQAYLESMDSEKPTTKGRALSSIRSLLAYAQKLGYVQFNPAATVPLPRKRNTLSERILSEKEVTDMMDAVSGRNHGIVRLLYATGIRVSELTGLTWKDIQPRTDGGQITVYGKGGKTRSVRISVDTWTVLEGIRPENARTDAPVFASRKKNGRLSTQQINRIVREAARNAGIEGNVSPHWLRHCHASHALDHGCPVHLVQATLGHSSIGTTSKYIHARPDESSSKFITV